MLSQSVFHRSPSLRGRLQCVLVSFEEPKGTRGMRARVLEISHIFGFLGQALYTMRLTW
jgi:hypothetical protein